MNSYLALDIIDGFIEVESDADYYAAWQYLVDTGEVWRLPGSYGRMARNLIYEGYLTDDNQDLWQIYYS